MSSLIQRHVETSFKRDKRQASTQHIFDKNFKTSFLIRRHTKTSFRRDKR